MIIGCEGREPVERGEKSEFTEEKEDNKARIVPKNRQDMEGGSKRK